MAGKKFYLLENKAGRSRQKNNKNKIILNTRVRLARNLANRNFVGMSSIREKNILLEEIKKYTGDIREFRDFQFYKVKDLKEIQRDVLFKDYMLDPEIACKMQGEGLLVRTGPSPGESLTVIINHEDHIRIQSVYSGLNIFKAYNEVARMEKYFEKRLSFAFDKNLGYLTASPFDLGTALRITVIAHLPILAVSSGIADFVRRISRIGCQIRGYFRGQSEIIGSLFKVFNQITLGKGEKNILEEMQAVCIGIIDDEQNARIQLKKKDLLGIKDNIYRSFGLLKYAKILSYEESLELLSIIRLGLDLDIIEGVKDFDFFELVNKISNPRIILDMEISDKITDDRIDSIRADMIRKKILEEVD